MNKKTLTSIFIIALISIFAFNGTITTAKAAPPRTCFYIESVLDEVIWSDVKLMSNNIVVWKDYYNRTILEGGTIEGVIYLDGVGVVNTQTRETHALKGFEIITVDGTISGRISVKYVFDPLWENIIEVQGTFIGHGYMNIKGTVDIGDPEGNIAVFEGYSW